MSAQRRVWAKDFLEAASKNRAVEKHPILFSPPIRIGQKRLFFKRPQQETPNQWNISLNFFSAD